jgi:hypothetical protein
LPASFAGPASEAALLVVTPAVSAAGALASSVAALAAAGADETLGVAVAALDAEGALVPFREEVSSQPAKVEMRSIAERAMRERAASALRAVGQNRLDLTQVAYLALGVTSSRT